MSFTIIYGGNKIVESFRDIGINEINLLAGQAGTPPLGAK